MREDCPMPQRLAVVLSAALLATAAAPATGVAAGDPDPAFGGTGAVLTDFGGEDSAFSVAVDPQGRVVAGGSGALADPARPGASGFALARYLPSGALDPSFSGDGMVEADFGHIRADVRAVLIDGQGGILAVGTTTSFDGIGSAIALARFRSDGTPDPSFGAGGLVETRLGLSGAGDAALDPQGRIVVAGTGQRQGALLPTVARYLPDGSLDQSFGEGGIREIRLGRFAALRSVAIDGAGRIAVLGDSSRSRGSGRIMVARLLADGSMDRAFGKRGKARVLAKEEVEGADLIASPSGAVTIAGTCECGKRERMLVARLKPSGQAARGFGDEGSARIGFPGRATATSLAADRTGRVLVAGEETRGWAFARLTRQGKPDRSFSGDGRQISPGLGGAEAVTIGPAGEPIAVGTGLGPAGTDFEVRRYLP
jgi:uncharacterized delta-60 repeat protein